MLLDYVRPVDIYNLGYYRLLVRGALVVILELLLLYIAYNDESPTSFVYFAFGGFIFAGKMRLRAKKSYDANMMCLDDRIRLEENIRDNVELFTVGITGRIFYALFAFVMTIIFICSIFNTKLQNDNDVYPFIQLKLDEPKTKYLLMVLGISWTFLLLDFTCGRSYHWSELMVYEKFNIKLLQRVIEYVLVYLIFTFSQQVRFSIFSLIFFFFVLLTITVFLISLLRENQKTVDFGRYISFLKWLTLSGMIVIYSKKSYKKFIDLFGKQQQQGNNGNFVKDLIDQFIDKEENFDRILIIFILSTLRQFFEDVSKMTDNIRSIIHTEDKIEKESYFVSYFATNILLLMGKRGSEIINYKGSYKLEYFKELAQAEKVQETFFTIFCKVKLKLSTEQKYYIWGKKIVQTVLSIAVTVFKNHMVIIFQLILNYLVIFKSQNMMLMIMPIIWCMLSFVAFNPAFAVTISIIFLYVPTSLAILQVMASSILCKRNGVIYNWLGLEHYCTFMGTYPILNDTTNTQIVSNETEKTRLFTMLSITILYVILLIEKKKKQNLISSTFVSNLNALTEDVQNVLYEDIVTLIKFIVSKIFSNFFYICLIFLFMGIIQTISLFNFLFIIFFFYFILKAEKAKQYWIFLLLYLQFLLVTRYLYSLKFFTFNLDRETSAMIGLYFGTGNPVEESSAMVSYWLVLIAISLQYQLFYTKLALEFRRVELEFNSRILEKVKLVAIEVLIGLRMVYMSTILWAFHFFLVLILIYSERTIFNVILMVMEVIFFFYHLRSSKTCNEIAVRRRLNKFWTVMVFTILFFSFLFYIFLFCKYTITKRFISHTLGLRPPEGEGSGNSILNRQIAEEFTMLYLIKQKQLSIEESSFIRENLKIMLAFVSFFKIMLDKEEIKDQEDNNAIANEESNEAAELKRKQEELNRALALGQIDSDEGEEEEYFDMGELDDSMRKQSGGFFDVNPLAPIQLMLKTKKPVEKLKFGINDILQIYERILVYLSHVWKSLILIHITVWTQEGLNIFKLIILVTVLITFYRYIRSATDLMRRSKLFEVIDKKLKYYSDAFVRKFEIDGVYPGLDIDLASDHYMVCNNNFYHSLKNQLSMINTQISKLLYYLVFNCAWIYFIYVYVNQVFFFFSINTASLIVNTKLGSAKSVVAILFTNMSGNSTGSIVDHKREQLISFMLVTLLVIEKKILEAVSKNLKPEITENQCDAERCADDLIAHLELYISAREASDPAYKSKERRAQSCDSLLEHSSIKVTESIETLKNKINMSLGNEKMQESIAQENSKRTLNKELLNRLMEGDSLDDIANKQSIRIYLHEKTSYLEKVLFFNVIKNKFSFAQVQYALLHNMQRVGIIFLMTIVTFSPTIINVLLLLIIFYLDIRNKSFSEGISSLCLISCVFILKDDILMMLSMVDGVKDKIEKYSFLYYHNQKVVYFATIFLLICNAFMLLSIGLTKGILIGVNTHKLPKSKIFWMFVVKKKKTTKSWKLHVDHKKWVSAGNSLLLTLRNLLYIYPLEVYLIIMISLPLLMFEKVTPYVMCFIAFPYLISFIQFKERDRKAEIERMFFKYFILLCWICLMVFYPVHTYMVYKKFNELFSPSLLKVEFTLPLAILINQTYKEFMATEDYEDTQQKLQKQRVLMSSLINYCYTYDYNEKKLRENVNIFVKQNHVIECTEKISTLGENNDLNFDADIVDDLFSYDENLLPIIYQKCTLFEKLRIKFYVFMYSSMLALNYEGIFESVFYLYMTFKHKNRKVISGESQLNLNQFLKLESDMMIESIKQAEQFYIRLKKKDTDNLKKFEEEFVKISVKIEDIAQKEKLRQDRSKEVEEKDQAISLDPISAFDTRKTEDKVRQSQRPEIDHIRAADMIFSKISGAKMTKANKDDIFYFNLKSNDFKSNEKLIFHNIQPYFIEQTNSFTKFDYMVLLKLMLGILLSNMEMIIILTMTIVHIWAGGVYAIIIFTIVFFILIEERPGQYKLWLVIDSIYLLVLIVIFTITTNYNFLAAEHGDNRNRTMLPSERGAELVLLLIGKVESQYGICIIFFLIILLRINFEKLGFYNKDIMSVETLPMAVHRIVINEDFYDVFDGQIEKKKLRVQAIEDKILKKFKDNKNTSLTWNYILKLEKERIRVDSLIDHKRKLYQGSAYKVILMLRRDMFRVYEEVTEKFLWRNFSKYVYEAYLRALSQVVTTKESFSHA